MNPRRRWSLVGSLAVLVVGFASPGQAQQDVSLNAVESLMAQGRILDARTILELWLEDEGAGVSRSDRQRSLWLRASLTVDPSMADRDFRRLTLEFPGGPFSDDALFRLALSAESRGDLRAAHAHFQGLVRDYPVSPLRSTAEAWLGEHADEVAALPAADPPEVAALPELSPPRPEPLPESIIEEEAGNLSVQSGAFQSLDRARQLADGLREAGYLPRVVRVPGSELVRVRVGRFRTRDEAEVLASELEGRGFDATIVRDAQLEEEVG